MTAKRRIDPRKRETGGREAQTNGPVVKDTKSASDAAKASLCCSPAKPQANSRTPSASGA